LRRLIDCHGRECQFTTGIIPLPGEAKSKIRWGKRKSSAPKRSRAR
jgi:hypothetical protein